MTPARRRLLGLAAAGAGMLGYSLVERTRYRLVRATVPVRRGTPELTVLHVSDLHIQARDERLRRFLGDLPDALGAVPDLVLATGDFIEDDRSIPVALEALTGLEARLGRFYVFGSHDYYQASLKLPTSYVARPAQPKGARAATTDLEAGLQEKGWVSLINRAEMVEDGGVHIRLCGVDDPFLGRHKTDHIAREADDDIAIGLTHAPDVVSEFILAGFDLVLAGHTHGGQVRVPGAGAVVTNCSLPTALARGLHRVGNGWLHVSPGLGTGKFAPIRFNCPPEVTLLTLASGGR